MLAQFVLMVFALFAVLSLVIDAGYARLTQAQMQIAADAAAIEGAHRRDIGVLNPATGQTVNDPFASDCLRRASANRLARYVFDDDLDLTNGDPDYQFGAGPILDLTGGVTNLHAGDTISVPDAHAYKPNLQMNQQNAVYGDMVSGHFSRPNPDPAASEGLAYAEIQVDGAEQNGSGVYSRNDFNPSPTSPQPPAGFSSCPPPDEAPPEPWPIGGTGTLANDDAFLVRLRRSNELQDFGLQTEPDVASSGPSLPLVFGRGTTIFGDDPSADYSIRRDGVTVRATGIAQVRPALHVGLPQTTLPGVTRFALRDTFVQTLNAAGTQVTINATSGIICTGVILPANIATCAVAAATAVGRFVTNPIAISTVGQALPLPAGIACGGANASGYGPVYSPMASGAGTNRIIGFTRIGLSADPARPSDPCAKVLSRGVSLVAASNATAILSGGLPLPVTVQPAEITELLARNCPAQIPTCGVVAGLVPAPVNYAPVLAPVLAR